LPTVKDKAERGKWLKWHNSAKRKLKEMLSTGVEQEKSQNLGEQRSWGRLDKYKPDITWRKNNKLSFFEVEYYYNQDKIVRDIVYACLLNAEQLVFIFSNKKTDWGDGRKRVEATYYLVDRLSHLMSKPLFVKAISIEKAEELEQKLKQERIE